MALPRGLGLSSLTRDAEGLLWTAPERQRQLIALDDAGTVRQTLALDGVTPGLDIEGLAWIAPHRFAASTEAGVNGGDHDLVLLLERQGDAVRVTQQLRFSYKPSMLRAQSNRGLEGSCFTEGRVIVASELSGRDADGRFAPLGVHRLGQPRWDHARLRLTSQRGNISALACRVSTQDANVIEVLAVERYFVVSRLLRFTLPLRGIPTAIRPQVLLDLGSLLEGHPNIEGVSWTADGSIALIADASWGPVQTENQLFLLSEAQQR